MEILRASKYRLEPTDEQAAWLAQTAGACRYMWNIGLEQRRDHFRKGRFSYVQQCRELTECRTSADWLKAAPVHALQSALWDLDKAFERFFLGLGGYPRPKRRDGADGFRLPDPSYLGFKRLSKRMGAVKLPKIGWTSVLQGREDVSQATTEGALCALNCFSVRGRRADRRLARACALGQRGSMITA